MPANIGSSGIRRFRRWYNQYRATHGTPPPQHMISTFLGSEIEANIARGQESAQLALQGESLDIQRERLGMEETAMERSYALQQQQIESQAGAAKISGLGTIAIGGAMVGKELGVGKAIAGIGKRVMGPTVATASPPAVTGPPAVTAPAFEAGVTAGEAVTTGIVGGTAAAVAPAFTAGAAAGTAVSAGITGGTTAAATGATIAAVGGPLAIAAAAALIVYKGYSMLKDTVLCTELYRQGKLDGLTYYADSLYGMTLDPEIREGYNLWAVPLAKLMSKSKTVTFILAPFIRAWANEMAFKMNMKPKGSMLGRCLKFVGEPVCKMLGKEVRHYAVP